MAFLHETQPEGEQEVAKLLYESGAVQVLVATAPMCWGLSAAAHLCVIMGTQVRPGGGPGVPGARAGGRTGANGGGGAGRLLRPCRPSHSRQPVHLTPPVHPPTSHPCPTDPPTSHPCPHPPTHPSTTT